MVNGTSLSLTGLEAFGGGRIMVAETGVNNELAEVGKLVEIHGTFVRWS